MIARCRGEKLEYRGSVHAASATLTTEKIAKLDHVAGGRAVAIARYNDVGLALLDA
jgi:hypothetical protein